MIPMLCNSGPLMALAMICATIIFCFAIYALGNIKDRFK